MRNLFIAAIFGLSIQTALAQSPTDPNVEACRSTGLLALQQTTPSMKKLIFSMESLAISKADTKVGDTAVRQVIMGDAYFETQDTGKAHRFVCLIGDKGKVLLTFFTSK